MHHALPKKSFYAVHASRSCFFEPCDFSAMIAVPESSACTSRQKAAATSVLFRSLYAWAGGAVRSGLNLRHPGRRQRSAQGAADVTTRNPEVGVCDLDSGFAREVARARNDDWDLAGFRVSAEEARPGMDGFQPSLSDIDVDHQLVFRGLSGR